jgi:transcriptional regulator
MYIPVSNLMTDRTEAIEFMMRFSFATIITAHDNVPVATHLPFVVSVENDTIILTSHFARANEQWKNIENNKILVIFTEPHAYISPKHYDQELNVPTWNYISIHAYGKAKIITAEQEVFEVLENTINKYEASYKQQWDRLPKDYKLRMSKGIVPFEIVVEDLQAKKKLSQNKTENERSKIIDSLAESKETNEQLIAGYMKKDWQIKKE